MTVSHCSECSRPSGADGSCEACGITASSSAARLAAPVGGARSAATSFSFQIPTTVSQTTSNPSSQITAQTVPVASAPTLTAHSKSGPSKVTIAAIAVAVVALGGLVAVVASRPSTTKAQAPTTTSAGPATAPSTTSPTTVSAPAPPSAPAITTAVAATTTTATTTAPPATRPSALLPNDVAATCESAPNADSQRNPVSYEPWLTADGRAETAWRCDGDASGESILFDFGRDMRVAEVGLLPGYAKVDPFNGINRFPEMRRVSSARWECVDAGGVAVKSSTQAFSDAARVQSSPVVGFDRCRALRVVIIATRAPGGTNDYTPVSEIVVSGWPL